MIDQIVATMLLIAAAMTGYEPIDPTTVTTREISIEDLRIYITGDSNSPQDFVASVSGSNIMYLRDDLKNEDELFVRAIVLHEAVHLLQNASDREFQCVGESEAEAYKIHLDWLETQGLTRSEAHKVMGTDSLFVFLITQCSMGGM